MQSNLDLAPLQLESYERGYSLGRDLATQDRNGPLFGEVAADELLSGDELLVRLAALVGFIDGASASNLLPLSDAALEQLLHSFYGHLAGAQLSGARRFLENAQSRYQSESPERSAINDASKLLFLNRSCVDDPDLPSQATPEMEAAYFRGYRIGRTAEGPLSSTGECARILTDAQAAGLVVRYADENEGMAFTMGLLDGARGYSGSRKLMSGDDTEATVSAPPDSVQ